MVLSWIVFFIAVFRVQGTHFQGGTISYKVMGSNASGVVVRMTQSYIYAYSRIYCNDTYIANQWPLSLAGYPDASAKLTCIANCATSGGYVPISVTPRCTDYSSGMDITVGQRSDDVLIENGSYFRVAFASSAWRNLSLPSATSTKSWSLSTLIDLRPRADGTFNTPPIATMISPIYIPVGVQQTIPIPTIDADGDQVRCRFASGTNECGTVCPSASLPSGTSISSNCVLTITGANAGDWYAVAVQVEDFADSTSTTPYSSVPVQFLIYVYDQPACSQRPYLYSENPVESCMGVQVGVPYTLQLIVENYCTSYNVTMVDIATDTFPVVLKSPIVQNTSTLSSVTLQWTPTADQIGSQIFCSVAVDSEDVQSNQYCLTFTVGNGTLGMCPSAETTTVTSTTTSTSAPVSNGTSTTNTTASASTTIVLVPTAMVIVCCFCCCCCCCGWWWLKPKAAVEPEEKSKKPIVTYTIEGAPEYRGYNARAHQVTPAVTSNESYPISSINRLQGPMQVSRGTTTSNDSTSLRFPITQSSDRSWRIYPRWIYPVTSLETRPSTRSVPRTTNTVERSRRTLPIKPRYVFVYE